MIQLLLNKTTPHFQLLPMSKVDQSKLRIHEVPSLHNPKRHIILHKCLIWLLVGFIGFRLSSVRYLLALEPDNYSVSSLALFTGINRETIVKLTVLSVKHIHSITAAALLIGPIFIRYADIS